jgi:hypothetical protein
MRDCVALGGIAIEEWGGVRQDWEDWNAPALRFDASEEFTELSN